MRKPPLREAVALAYGHRATPVVTARGRDEMADRIIAQARLHGIHVAEDPVLLAMLTDVDIEQEIPHEAYAAVAVVLSWVYWLRGMRPGDEKRGPVQGQAPHDDAAPAGTPAQE